MKVLVGLQEQSVSSVFTGLNWDTGTRDQSDLQRSRAPRSGSSKTCNTWLYHYSPVSYLETSKDRQAAVSRSA